MSVDEGKARDAFVRQTGIIRFGIPMSIFSTILNYRREFGGLSWEMFATGWFWFFLIISLLCGYIAGVGFGRTMWWLIGKNAYLHKHNR